LSVWPLIGDGIAPICQSGGASALHFRRHQIARTPNYSFERQERERAKANKLAQKANEKREQRERERALSQGSGDSAPAPDDE
jgi:hypothetical protein